MGIVSQAGKRLLRCRQGRYQNGRDLAGDYMGYRKTVGCGSGLRRGPPREDIRNDGRARVEEK